MAECQAALAAGNVSRAAIMFSYAITHHKRRDLPAAIKAAGLPYHEHHFDHWLKGAPPNDCWYQVFEDYLEVNGLSD